MSEPVLHSGTTTQDGSAQTSLGKGLELLSVMAELDQPVGVSTLAARTGRPKSSVHRMLATLSEMQVVEQVSDGRYAIGLRLFEIGSRAAARTSMREVAARELRGLSERLGETAHLGLLDDGAVVYIEKVEGTHSIRMSSQVGRRNPLHCTGIGKALVAIDQEQIEAVCAGELAAMTSRTIVHPDELREELELTRARGFAIDDEEVEIGLRCVGAPLAPAEGRRPAAISVAGPTMRMELERCLEIGSELVAVAARISRSLDFGRGEAGS